MSEPDETVPQVIMPPDMQAQIDADPKLKQAMAGMTEAIKNAMQGVKDGRYTSFEDAMEAMTGERPIKHEIAPRYPVKHGYCLSVGPDPRGDGLMAVISDGHPRRDADCTILDVRRVKTQAEAEQWCEVQCLIEPWADAAEEAGPATHDP